MTPSLGLRGFALYFRATRGPRSTPEALRRAYEGRVYPEPAPPPRRLAARCRIVEKRDGDRVRFVVSPRFGGSSWRVVYLHGGGFANGLQGAHWNAVKCIVRATGATVIVPVYPLAPEHTFELAHAQLEATYRELLEEAPPSRIVLCGDSAGGNLALVQALRYRDAGLPLPAHVVLFAPWLDVTMTDARARALEGRDVMLRVDELIELGRWWAGATDPRDPRVSPLFADLRGLPPIQIHQGADDVFLHDARTLAERVRASGGRVELIEVEGGFHVYMLATITRESRATFRRLRETLRPR